MARVTPKGTETVKVGWSMAHRIMRKYLEKGYNTLWTGMPGIGKTALVKMIAKELGYTLIIFHPVISDPTDFKGIPWCFTDQNGKQQAVFIAFDQLEALINAKGPTICFLDDLGQAPESVQAAAMQLLHGGTLNGKAISKHVRFIAATNRKQDRAGVTGILEPVKSRFHFIGELVPELEPLCNHLISTGASPVLVAFLKNRPEWIMGGVDGWKPHPDICNQPCPRTIEHLSDSINLGLEKIVRPVAYSGAVGQGMSNEYVAFEELANNLPNVEAILTNPLGAPKPASNEQAYAIIGALHTRMTRKNLSNIYSYIKMHFARELQVVFHWDVEKYQPELQKHEAYISWSQQNGDRLSN